MAVVDDDADVRGGRRRSNSLRIRHGAFVSGAEFTKATRDRTPGCVVLDLHTPEMTVFEVKQLLHEVMARCRCRSSLAGTLPRLEAMRSPWRKGHLVKPVDGEVSLEAIAGCCKNRTDRSPYPTNRKVP